MSDELREILRDYPICAPYLPEIEEKIKQWAMGLLPKELKDNQSISMFGVDLRFNNGWNSYRNEIRRKIKDAGVTPKDMG